MSPLEDAIWLTESSRSDGKRVFGPKGEIGPLQITYGCWQDATEHNPDIGGRYADCHNLDYSLAIFRSYMDRYARGMTDVQKARIWYGGPKGCHKNYTLGYRAVKILQGS